MATLDPVIERVRAHSGADFAFVLTRKGRLVTHAAPRDMPEVGRARLVRAAKPLGIEEVVELTMPRQDLVPYGGAAPVDVYLAVAAEQAILCVVMATWADKIRVVAALTEGLRALEPILHYRRPRKSTVPPPPKEQSAGLVSLAGSVATASRALQRAPAIHAASSPPGRRGSLPDIAVGEAPLGRESLAAIDLDVRHRGSAPEIVVAEASLGRETLAAIETDPTGKRKGSAPEIAIGTAPLGRETLAAIDLEMRPPATSMPDHIRVELESAPDEIASLRPTPDPSRMTQPWIEAPEDAKRAADGARFGRKLTPPRLSLKLEEADESLKAALRAEGAAPAGRKR